MTRATGWILLAALGAAAAPLTAQNLERGKVVYDKWCAGCHGDTGLGDGAGAKFMLPPPRDFTAAKYQIRTTASGELPSDADLERVLADGMPGTAMPEWKTKLSDAERKDVVAYIKKLSTFFEGAPAPQVLDFGRAPGGGAAAIADGKEQFVKVGCVKCHGDNGRGNGKSAPTLKDDWDFPIRAANLTQNWNFNGGGTVEDIYHRLRTGLDGTPMPSYSDAVDAKQITDEQLWHIAQYVRSLSPAESPPAVKEVIRAVPVVAGAALPTGPGDSSWSRAEPYFIPVVGQIIAKPRWFAPNVDGLWVQAMHDSTTLTVRVSWGDRSQSPDPAWDEWMGRLVRSVSDVDGPVSPRQGPDRLWVQFPKKVTDEGERPYFLGGSSRRPVYLWRWSSAPDRVEEGTGTGLGRFTALPGTPGVTHAATYDDGLWRVQFTRSLVPADSMAAPTFGVGRAIPIAFFAGDGSNGETDTRGAVSAWYAIYLDVPTPPGVYVVPVVAVLLTAGLGLVVVWRAQQLRKS